MPSFTTYQLLGVWVPSICVSLIFLSMFILVALKVGLKVRRRKTKLVNRWLFEILRLAFRNLKRDKMGRNILYGQQIGQVSFALLIVIAVPVIISACFITFWNVYLVEEQIGNSCNSNYDCFPISGGQVLQENPVNNCTSWPEDTRYKCYRLVYNYERGISATGGLVFFASLLLKIYTATLLAPYNMHNVCYKWTCYFLTLIGGTVIVVVFIVIHTALPHSHDIVFLNETNKIQFFFYCFLLFVIFVITGPLLLYGIECESPLRCSEEDTEGILQDSFV